MKVEVTSESGFSLLEILVALGILAIGLASVFALFIAGTAAHRRAIDRHDISEVAEQCFADLESTIQARWALSRGEDPMEFLSQLEREPPLDDVKRKWPDFDLTLELLPVVGSSDEVVARLTVRWKNRGADRREVFEQIVLFASGEPRN